MLRTSTKHRSNRIRNTLFAKYGYWNSESTMMFPASESEWNHLLSTPFSARFKTSNMQLIFPATGWFFHQRSAKRSFTFAYQVTSSQGSGTGTAGMLSSVAFQQFCIKLPSVQNCPELCEKQRKSSARSISSETARLPWSTSLYCRKPLDSQLMDCGNRVIPDIWGGIQYNPKYSGYIYSVYYSDSDL